MMYRSPCLDEREPGVWICRNRGIRLRSTAERIVCVCDSRLNVVQDRDVCPFHAVIETAGVDISQRLGRCRTSACGLLAARDGRTVCLGMGQTCEQLANWSKFLASTDECPHWKE